MLHVGRGDYSSKLSTFKANAPGSITLHDFKDEFRRKANNQDDGGEHPVRQLRRIFMSECLSYRAQFDTFLDQGSRSERYLQIKAHFEV